MVVVNQSRGGFRRFIAVCMSVLTENRTYKHDPVSLHEEAGGVVIFMVKEH